MSKKIFETISSRKCIFPALHNNWQFVQSHEPEFDYLKSLEIEEKINKIRWGTLSQILLLFLRNLYPNKPRIPHHHPIKLRNQWEYKQDEVRLSQTPSQILIQTNWTLPCDVCKSSCQGFRMLRYFVYHSLLQSLFVSGSTRRRRE